MTESEWINVSHLGIVSEGDPAERELREVTLIDGMIAVQWDEHTNAGVIKLWEVGRHGEDM